MKKMVLLLMITGSVCWIACDKELDITDFEDEFGNYQPELKIEGLLRLDKPEDVNKEYIGDFRKRRKCAETAINRHLTHRARQ